MAPATPKCDVVVGRLLTEVGLGHFKEHFRIEGVTLEIASRINEVTLRAFFPHIPLGPGLRFLDAVKRHVESTCQGSRSENPLSSVVSEPATPGRARLESPDGNVFFADIPEADEGGPEDLLDFSDDEGAFAPEKDDELQANPAAAMHEGETSDDTLDNDGDEAASPDFVVNQLTGAGPLSWTAVTIRILTKVVNTV